MEAHDESSKQTNDEFVEEMNTTGVSSPHEALAPASEDTQVDVTTAPSEDTPVDVTTAPTESENVPRQAVEEPSVDWFEPLEEDNDEHDLSWDVSANGRREAEEESLASEKSSSVGGSERSKVKTNTGYKIKKERKKRTHPDEGWEDWDILEEGWKRKVVIRQSGSSVGQHDVYYMSPQNVRVRSRVELAKVLDKDLSTFEYKSGLFGNNTIQIRRRNPNKVKKIQRDKSPSSDECWVDRADSPDPPPKRTPKSISRISQSYHKSPPPYIPTGTPSREPLASLAPISPASEEGIVDSATTLPMPSVNGNTVSNVQLRTCAKCGSSYTTMGSEKPRKRFCCPKCRAKKPVDNRRIVFRKWIPCGQCMACKTTVNCGRCASCKNGMLNEDLRKPVRCRKRKCLCPIRKNKDNGPRWVDPIMDRQHPPQVVKTQNSSYQTNDMGDYSVYVDVDGDDEEFHGNDEDYEEWVKKRKRRACGKCEACVSRKDCGNCDFCFDKPKFGGSNKKRQKCRLRQCQRQAMRHLLPSQLGLGEFESQDALRKFGRPKPHHTYSRKKGPSKRKLIGWDEEKGHGSIRSRHIHGVNFQLPVQGQSHGDTVRRFFAGSPGIGNAPAVCFVPPSVRSGAAEPGEEEVVTPMITKVFSLAPASVQSNDMDPGLLKLLEATRKGALPILWYAIMKEGPQLVLVQCSKQSTMTDTTVQIDPGFSYQITVQDQPLLLTHPLYEDHPPRLTSVTTVVNLLLELEGRYKVCHGVPNTEPPSSKEPIICERASTCDFLITKDVDCCAQCRALSL